MSADSSLFAASHSGAKLRIDDGNNVVKTYTNTERSRKAIQLQKEFQEIKNKDFLLRSIPILEVREHSDKLHVTMPYIHGFSGERLCLAGTPELAGEIRNIISMYFALKLSNAVRTKVSNEIVLEKIKSLSFSLGRDEFLAHAAALYSFVESKSSLYLPLGDCHGDLTFSNFAYNNKGILYVYDFLPSFISSPILDLAKLKQDVLHGWSIRGLAGGSFTTGLMFMRESTPTEVLDSLFSTYGVESHIFSSLNLLRIAPYLNDQLTKEWLCARLEVELHNLQQN